MREHIIELKNISDTKEFIEQKVPNFMIVFIYIFLLIIMSALVWMWFSEIDIVVKANGVVRPDRNVSTVINVNSGLVDNISFKEGQHVKTGDVLYTVDASKLEFQKETINKTKEKFQNKLANLKRFEKSINENRNLFKKSEIEYYNRFISYSLKNEQLELEYKQAELKFKQEKSLGLDFTTEAKLNELKSNWDYAKLNLEKSKSETMYSIKSEILEKENEVIKLKNQLKEIEKNIEFGTIKSPITGTIQVIKNYNINDYINSGEQVLKIIPEGTNFKMDISVNNKDISQIKRNQRAKFRFLAFPYKEYGIVEGKIKTISEDVAINQKNSSLVYKVEANIPETKLYNRNGKEGIVKVGMASDIRIISRRKKIFYIVLEKLNFIEDL